ncbi:MAG: hypothetical protein PHC38_04780 [Weeksellaceae bacterium]|nr:hypothetical protein [Weeksellaceae bacterium]
MKINKLHIISLLISLFFILSCTLDNLDDENNLPKTDFNSYNYVLATEDASTADITRFFSFNLNEVDPDLKYDLIDESTLFTNSDPSTSSGHHFYKNFIFSMAKDKKGYSSTPGLFRLTLNTANRIFIDSEIFIGKNNLFPSRKLCLVDEHTGFFYNEDIGQQTIQKFDPTTMNILGSLDLKPYIEAFRPDAVFQDESGNNLVRTGSLVMDYKNDKLYVSVVFIESAGFNLIAENEENFYLAVIDIPTFSFEKIIQYHGAKTVGFYVSENNPTTKDEDGNLYFCSWGWNQFYSHNPSKIFRIKKNETEFDTDWVIDIEALFGEGRVAQSIISYNNKLYLHISDIPYYFASSEQTGTLSSSFMHYYEFDINNPTQYRELEIPASNTASRVNVFTILDTKLFMCVPNSVEGKFNGVYSVDLNGEVQKELSIDNKYRPTRLYKLEK